MASKNKDAQNGVDGEEELEQTGTEGNDELNETLLSDMVSGDSDDDLEAQMAAAMAAESMAVQPDEDDLEAQMAAAMAADSPIGSDYSSNDAPMTRSSNFFGSFHDEESAPVKKADFQQLTPSDEIGGKENIERLLDVGLNVSVELGRKSMKIREILGLGPGKIIELDKLAGEPVDLLVNGKLLAKGEVVVVDENFGVRITELVDPIDRIKMLR
jgi:flagellar motor switch protein FliN